MTDAILLIGDSESNQTLYYKTHFLAGDPFIYLETGGKSMVVVSGMEGGRASKESCVDETRTFDDFGYRELVRELQNRTKAFTTLVQRVVEDAGAGPITIEPTFPVAYADALRSAGSTLVIEPDLFVRERRQKTTEEVAAIEASQRATERAMRSAIDIIGQCDNLNGVLHYAGIPLTSERLRGEIEIALTREGMDPGSPIVAGGPSSADPHWLGTGPLRWGEAIILDVFPRSKSTRFFADMTRTVVKGNPGDLLRRMYRATENALDAALAEIRPGANGHDIHARAEAIFSAEGFGGEGSGPRFVHGTGHGVGLDIHEHPSLGALDVKLLDGDVLTIEPGLYDPQTGGVRIEDMVVVTADGYRNLTHFPRQFEV